MSRRTSRVVSCLATLLVLPLAAGCGADRSPAPSSATSPYPPSPPATVTAATPSPPPASMPPPSVRISPGPEGYVAASIDHSRVRTVRLPETFHFHRASVDGPRVVMDELAGIREGAGREIALLDFERGTREVIYLAREGSMACDPVIRGNRVAWIERRYADVEQSLGPLEWSVLVRDLRTGETARIASGVQRRAPQKAGASWPVMDLAGDRIAYAIEDGKTGSIGWKIAVFSLATGLVEREIPTARAVYDLGVSEAGDVAYTDGSVDPRLGYTYDGKLYLARVGQPIVKLADEAYGLSLRDGRLAWEQTEPPPPLPAGATRPPNTGSSIRARFMSVSLTDLTPRQVSPGPMLGSEAYQRNVSSGDGYVFWDSFRPGMAGPTGDRLCFWRERSDVAYELPTVGAVNDVGGGWFTWSDHYAEPNTMNAAPLSAIQVP